MSRYVLETGMIKPPDPRDKNKGTKTQNHENEMESKKRKVTSEESSKQTISPATTAKPSKQVSEPAPKSLSTKVTSMRVNICCIFLSSSLVPIFIRFALTVYATENGGGQATEAEQPSWLRGSF